MSGYERKHLYSIQTPTGNGKEQEKAGQSRAYLACSHGPVNSAVTMAGWSQKEDSRGQALSGHCSNREWQFSLLDCVLWGEPSSHWKGPEEKCWVLLDLVIPLGFSWHPALPPARPPSGLFYLPHLWKQMTLGSLKGRCQLGISLLCGWTAGRTSQIPWIDSLCKNWVKFFHRKTKHMWSVLQTLDSEILQQLKCLG